MIANNRYIKGSKGVPPPKTPMKNVMGWTRKLDGSVLVALDCGHVMQRSADYIIPERARCHSCEQKGRHRNG